jgi:uncharacterized membrane protein
METMTGGGPAVHRSGDGRTRQRQDGTRAQATQRPALRGQPPGRKAWTGAEDGQAMARMIGWFSVGLGATQLVAPRSVARLIGVRPGSGTTAVMRTMGVREIAHGVGILSNPSSKEWVGTRIGGDLLDLALLGVALTRSEDRQRTLLATAVVLGATALDVRGTEKLSQSRKAPTPDVMDARGVHVIRSITVERPVQEVYTFWHDFTNLPHFMKHLESVEVLASGRSRWRAAGPAGTSAEWEAEITEDRENERISWRSIGSPELYNEGTVRFEKAPADRGTIVTVEMQYSPPGGTIGAALLKLFRKEPGQQVGDDLRRLKQVMETGEVLLSDATAARGAHAAQPVAREDRR